MQLEVVVTLVRKPIQQLSKTLNREMARHKFRIQAQRALRLSFYLGSKSNRNSIRLRCVFRQCQNAYSLKSFLGNRL